MTKYSADGRTLQGTAYGPRIFNYPRVDLDQWARIRTVLREDPDSKRAGIQIFDPIELRESNNIDVACTLALQFLIRDGALCTVGFMRANDAFRGMVSDIFSFTMLQELMARQLGGRSAPITTMSGQCMFTTPIVSGRARYWPRLPAGRPAPWRCPFRPCPMATTGPTFVSFWAGSERCDSARPS